MQRRVCRVLAVAGIVFVVASATAGCAHRDDWPPAREERRYEWQSGVQWGYATWYGSRFSGHRTASGEVFDPGQMTAAHRSLPFGTWVEVRCADTGMRVRVRITDRGPFGHDERIIDLSRAAAERLGIRQRGVAPVELRVVGGP
ncbi:MAG: septal ring lytic transglycosylase RlpA family protein [Polyangiaceae bacterium]|nr:septal ring lytic transglycosylase RlpA family protein [Polyangiaceae bacterium]